jgi:uncharacterized protein (TIGR03546 family)
VTLLLKQLFAFIKLLNSDTGTNQLAAGIVCGMVLGFTPAFSLQTLLVLVLLFFFRIQAGAAFASAFFFKLIAWGFDPVFDLVGGMVLSSIGLKPLFVAMYNMPIVPLTRFNNSIVMGAGIVALALAVPLFFIARVLIASYRVQFVERFRKTNVWKAVQATGFYKWYVKYDQLFG